MRIRRSVTAPLAGEMNPLLWLGTNSVIARERRASGSATGLWSQRESPSLWYSANTSRSGGCKILIRGSPPVVVSATSTSLRRCLLRAAGDLRLTVSTGQDAATKCEYYQKRPL